MSEMDLDYGRENVRAAPPRRARLFLLIGMLLLLLVAVLVNLDADGERRVEITYAQFVSLGTAGGLHTIELNFDEHRVKIRGSLNKGRIAMLIDARELDATSSNTLAKRSLYRVEPVMRGVIDEPATVREMTNWVAAPSRFHMRESDGISLGLVYRVGPWLLIGFLVWVIIQQSNRRTSTTDDHDSGQDT